MKLNKASFEAKVKDGSLIFYNNTLLKKFLAGLQGDLWVTIEKLNTTRTLSQNALYWLYLGVIADETGDDVDSLHEFLRRKLLPPKIITAMGKEYNIPRSTTELTKSDFGEYLDKIAALTNIPIPETKKFSCDQSY